MTINSPTLNHPMPIRIKLSRKRGYKLPPNTKKVDRTTPWGNPFHIVPPHWAPRSTVPPERQCPSAEVAVANVRTHLQLAPSRPLVHRALRELRGFNLACWCQLDHPCHADVWLDIVNA